MISSGDVFIHAIHPSIHPYAAFWVMGDVFLSCPGLKAGFHCGKMSSLLWPTQGHKPSSAFLLWREVGVPRENAHGQDANSSQEGYMKDYTLYSMLVLLENL